MWRLARFPTCCLKTSSLAALLVTICVVKANCADTASVEGLDLYERRIRPLFVDHCYECHSVGSDTPQGGLLLDSATGIRRGGDSGAAIVPGNVGQSLLVSALRWDLFEMPPNGRLPDSSVADVTRWIALGAPVTPARELAADTRTDDAWANLLRARSEHWCWQPVRKQALPRIADLCHPVDRFIQQKLLTHGLSLAGTASRRTLIRRLKFVLLGLPPTREEIDAFEQDTSPADVAWLRLVDRYLASPAFGERWARHWMDVVRYAETHGSEHDAVIPKSWRYRDYLIRAWNGDVGYAQFVREHLAGDLPENARWDNARGVNEAAHGTAWARMTEFYHAPVDVKNEEAAVMENIIDTFGKAFQAQTMACSRCHNHKFDPISSQDYYALYGIFAGSRQGMLIVDEPGLLHAEDAELRHLKQQLRRQLAVGWRREIATWRGSLSAAIRFVHKNETNPADLSVAERAWLASLSPETPPSKESPLALLVRLGPQLSSPAAASDGAHLVGHQVTPHASYSVFADLRTADLKRWFGTGPGFEDLTCSPPGEFAVAQQGDRLISTVLPAGVYSHLISQRHGGTLRSPSFDISSRYISALVMGEGRSRLRLVIENFQGDSILFSSVTPRLRSIKFPRWLQLPIREPWLGRRAYLELLCGDDDPYVGIIGKSAPGMDRKSDGRSAAGMLQVVFHDAPGDRPQQPFCWDALDLPADGGLEGRLAAAARFVDIAAEAVDAWQTGRATDRDAHLLAALLDAKHLSNSLEQSMEPAILVRAYRQRESQVRTPRRVPGLVDQGWARDVAFMPRGNHRTPGAAVPRRYLEVLGAGQELFLSQPGSGRRELASSVAAAENPLTARVMVNRLWQWTFGRGLVASVDNFGVMGEPPSHPELLDYLASEFTDHEWSMKAFVRLLVTSETFRTTSKSTARVRELDPANLWWQHADLRRLEAEAIRDAILATTGPLNRQMFGSSIPVWLADSYVTNHKPKSGPLDGNRRRSVYIEVRRNSPFAFLDVFDRPKPAFTTGRREVTNVPAQSLTMLNDPFVAQQATYWATDLLRQSTEMAPRQVITRMYYRAFGRPPRIAELVRAEEFLGKQAVRLERPADNWDDVRLWGHLAHALLNHKEFLFLR